MINEYEAVWTGSYPCLCHGEWQLLLNGKKIETEIPFKNNPAGTRKTFHFWSFGGESGWGEIWTDYEDGLDADAWIEEYEDWLKTITKLEENWYKIYSAFNGKDWRHHSCGGCI